MRRARRRTHLALHKAVVVVVDVTEGQRDENQNQQHGDEGTNRQSSRRRHLVDSLLGSSAVLYELSVSVLARFCRGLGWNADALMIGTKCRLVIGRGSMTPLSNLILVMGRACWRS